MNKLPMVEIFSTIEGEGTAAGQATTFVRIFNCNLRCTYCDTKYSYAPHKPQFYSTIENIIQEVKKYKNKYICLTGGEPLLYKNLVMDLLLKLCELKFIKDIHIETNGAIDLEPFVDALSAKKLFKKIRFIMDYKLSKSGELEKMIHSNLKLLTSRDELKFVIHDKDEFAEAIDILKSFNVKKPKVLFSPAYGIMDYAELADLIKENYKDGRLNLQLHKLIWDSERRGV